MPHVIHVFIFCSWLGSIKNRDEGKNGRESNNEIKKELFKSLMVRLNLSSDDVRNCKETTTFIKKKRNPRFGVYTRSFI